MVRRAKGKSHPKSGGSDPAAGAGPAGKPEFAQTNIAQPPAKYRVKHASDGPAYKILDAHKGDLKPFAFPAARGGVEPVLTLAQIYGSQGAAVEKAVTDAQQLVFHSVGDTGNTSGPAFQEKVTDKMVADFADPEPTDHPQFFMHLGDVIYSFGEAQYYYDQFYDAYRNYPAPILALAGNHDGMVAPNTHATTLDAFLRNFCAENFVRTPEAGGLERTAQIQPGVYFTFQAPMLRILCLYSNVLEDPGVISSQGGAYPELSDVQLDYLRAALTRVKKEKFKGAVILAHHHPAYTLGGERGHGSSTAMRLEIDKICDDVGVWPHAVLSAHAHNYQRYTRRRGKMEIPYLIAGAGGHSKPQTLTKPTDPPLRTPLVITTDKDKVTLDSYDQTDLGYLRIVVTPTQLTIEYHPSEDGYDSKTPDDQVTVDLASQTLAATRK